MSDFVPTESSRVVIGVCGEQGAGKTVFLTCIFQSLGMHLPNDVIFDFDRKEIGNATYFQSVEEQLIRDGVAPGNQRHSTYPVRIYFRPADQDSLDAPRLSLDLIDFAGGHFRSLADLRSLSGDDDSAETLALREVTRFMDSAHAFIILINSREIDPLSDTPNRYPFSPSINYLLGHCQERKKPVALLFSQIDQCKSVETSFASLPRVQHFRQRFSAELDEHKRGNQPFGFARTISCYQTMEGDIRPVRQSQDGNIWRPEPADVVLDLLQVVRPQIERGIAEERRRTQEREEAAQRAEERRRNRKIFGWASVLVLGGGLLATAAHCLIDQRLKNQMLLMESVAVRLRAGTLAALPAEVEPSVSEVLRAHREQPEATPQPLRATLGKLEKEFDSALARAVAKPQLDATYATEVSALVAFGGRLVPQASRKAALSTVFDRGKLLGQWFAEKRPTRRDRTTFLDLAARRFLRAGDRDFAAALSEASLREKEREILTWSERLDLETQLTNRLASLQSLLAGTLREKDAELTRLARKAALSHLFKALLRLEDTPWIRSQILKPLVPALATTEDAEVRFDLVAREALACETEEECETAKETIEAAFGAARSHAIARSVAVENLLLRIFRGLSGAEQRELWSVAMAEFAGVYLFHPTTEAWPAGVVSLPTSIGKITAVDSSPTALLVERFARLPLYQAEFEYLEDHVNSLAARRKLVPLFSQLISRSEDRRAILGLGLLASIRGQISASVNGREDGPLLGIRRDLDEVLELADDANSSRIDGTNSSAPAKLRQRLEALRRDYCSHLASHALPMECRDAA